MNRAIIAVVACLVSFAPCWPDRGATEEQKTKASAKIMQDKLHHAQKLLEGIALADFKKISVSAEELIQLSKTLEWQVHNTPKYELFTNEFRRAADGVIAKAKVKNIDGVTLAYFEMTMSCVRCHTYVREIRDARLPGGPVYIGEERDP